MEQVLKYQDLFVTYAATFGGRIVEAILVWIVGGWLINFVGKLANRAMKAQKVDPTLVTYVGAALMVVLRIALVIAILSLFGIETTSFAALIAAAGIAIGAAWSGLLANFAAGVFLIILRPFKVGDSIAAGGVSGDVIEIGMFATTLNTADNVRVLVGNNKLFADNIVNYAVNPYRRVDLRAQLPRSADPQEVITRLKAELKKIKNVLSSPEPVVAILEFNQFGTLLAVRPFCSNNDYGQVYFDTNDAILRIGVEMGWHK